MTPVDDAFCPLCPLAFAHDMALSDHLVLDHDDDTTWAMTADGRIVITAYVMEEPVPIDREQIVDDVEVVLACAAGFLVGLLGFGWIALQAARKVIGR